MSSNKDRPSLVIGRYRHYKGGEYQVYGVAQHSETGEFMVVYRPLYGAAELWLRPYDMFVEDVLIEGKSCPRFALIEQNLPSL